MVMALDFCSECSEFKFQKCQVDTVGPLGKVLNPHLPSCKSVCKLLGIKVCLLCVYGKTV